MIESISINGEKSTDCLSISGSDVYFIINNSKFYNTHTDHAPYYSGILISNVKNGLILQNSINSNYRGDFLFCIIELKKGSA